MLVHQRLHSTDQRSLSLPLPGSPRHRIPGSTHKNHEVPGRSPHEMEVILGNSSIFKWCAPPGLSWSVNFTEKFHLRSMSKNLALPQQDLVWTLYTVATTTSQYRSAVCWKTFKRFPEIMEQRNPMAFFELATKKLCILKEYRRRMDVLNYQTVSPYACMYVM